VAGCFGAVELGGSKVLCAVGSSHRDLQAQARFDTGDPEATLSAVEGFFAPHATRLSSLGVASFGPLELDAASDAWGSLLATPKPHWSGTPIAARFARRLRVPVVIDTDVNAAALAEQAWGSAQGADPCVYLTVGTGIGVGVVINGAPLHGLMHPELGHLRAPDACDFVGVCPFHGRCVEGVASAPALRARLGTAPESVADDHPVWALEAQYLGHLVATCVLAYSPRRVVLGGGVMARSGLLERVRREVVAQLASYVPRPELSEAGIAAFLVAPGLGQTAGLSGAFLLAERARP
jgi:fructokinase